MKTIFLIIVLSFVFLSCSSTNTPKNSIEQAKIEEKKEEELNIFSEEIQQNIKINNIDYLREKTIPSLRNKYFLEYIEKIDFSRVPILSEKAKYSKNKGSLLIGIIFQDRTEYMDIKFSYRDSKWKIEDFKQRR